MFKFRSNSGQKCSPEPEPEQKGCSSTGIPVDLCTEATFNLKLAEHIILQSS